MKRTDRSVEPISPAVIDSRFEGLQKDFLNPVAHVLWAGERIVLYVRENDRVKSELAHITADGDAIRKIKLWCIKNSYRCPQVRDGLIYL